MIVGQKWQTADQVLQLNLTGAEKRMIETKVLVTGAAGFIGSNLTEALLQRGHEVRGLDNLSQGHKRNIRAFLSNPKFAFTEGDVRDEVLVEKLMKNIEVVVHLAAFKIPRYGGAIDALLINTRGAANVLKAARESGCRVIIASTSDVYGKNPHVPFDENSDLHLGESTVKRWAYAISKIFDEHLAFAYQEELHVPIVILRFFGAYGPKQHLSWWGGPQSVFINAALNDGPMEIHGDGGQIRSFTYISDTVEGIMQCIEREEVKGHIFNLGNPSPISIHDLAVLIWGLIRSDEPKMKFVSYKAFGKYEDVRNRIPDISKAQRLLGFRPGVGLEEGLQKTIAWQRQVMHEERL
jgi:UDP-glucose 4-epimerase